MNDLRCERPGGYYAFIQDPPQPGSTIELRHLRYFLGVADQLSFRKAAEALHVSQTALTSQIRDLEAELGVKLLERDTRGVQGLTHAGQRFAEDARHIVASADSASSRMRAYASGKSGRISIGNINVLAATLLAPNLALFREQHPNIEITLSSLSMAEHTDALLSRSIDLGFTMGPRRPFPKEIEVTEIFRSEIRAILATHHPLAAHARVPLAELVKETFVTLKPKPHLRLQYDQVSELFRRQGYSIGATVEIDSYEAIFAEIASTRGYSIFPDFTMPSLPPGTVARGIAPVVDDWIADCSALTRRGESSPAVAAFVAILREFGKARMAPPGNSRQSRVS